MLTMRILKTTPIFQKFYAAIFVLLCCCVLSPVQSQAQSDNHSPNIDPGEFATRNSAEGWKEGFTVPDLKFNDVAGKKFSLYELLDKPTILEFYTLNCQQCAKNKNYLKNFYRQYDINIVGICTDDGYPTEIDKRAKAADLTWSNVMDDSKKFGGSTFAQNQGMGDVKFVLILPDKTIKVLSNNEKHVGRVGVELQKYFGK